MLKPLIQNGVEKCIKLAHHVTSGDYQPCVTNSLFNLRLVEYTNVKHSDTGADQIVIEEKEPPRLKPMLFNGQLCMPEADLFIFISITIIPFFVHTNILFTIMNVSLLGIIYFHIKYNHIF